MPPTNTASPWCSPACGIFVTKAMSPKVIEVSSDAQIARCVPILRELRPHYSASDLITAIAHQQRQYAYRLVFIEAAGEVQAVAGFRITHMLAFGKMLYVDDLITRDGARSQGHGQRLFDWLIAQARQAQCARLELDSGVQRFDAHRFYLRNRMQISSHHFSLTLPREP